MFFMYFSLVNLFFSTLSERSQTAKDESEYICLVINMKRYVLLSIDYIIFFIRNHGNSYTKSTS